MDPRIESFESTKFLSKRLSGWRIADIQGTMRLFPKMTRNPPARSICGPSLHLLPTARAADDPSLRSGNLVKHLACGGGNAGNLRVAVA